MFDRREFARQKKIRRSRTKKKRLNGVKSREDVENDACFLYFLWYFLLVGVNVRAGSYKYQLESKIEKLAKKKQKKVHKKD